MKINYKMRMNKRIWSMGVYFSIVGLIASFQPVVDGVWGSVATILSACTLISLLDYQSDRLAKAYGKSEIMYQEYLKNHDR